MQRLPGIAGDEEHRQEVEQAAGVPFPAAFRFSHGHARGDRL